ncbi:MAG TPA: helix-turn-helix transcriptional regulator [Microvirga sp.]|jgi:DNA-binding CsgD family transcriptional regulator|nr:helix-turn-helix transcriptional regulator [Microvirga sp.]
MASHRFASSATIRLRRQPAAVPPSSPAPPRPAVEPFPSLEELSPQERRVVALFALDYTNKEIARELSISADTVKTYARRIYAKLGVRTKAGCVAAAYSRLME